MTESIVYYTISGSTDVKYGMNNGITPPPTSSPVFGTMSIELPVKEILTFDFDGYKGELVGQKLDDKGEYSQVVDQDTSFSVTVNGDGGSFYAKALGHGTYTQFISTSGQLKRLVTFTVDAVD